MNMVTPLFSIIIPVYKVENYLEICIESILRQDFSNYEIILVDDGSPDKCPAICDKYSSNYSHIKVIHKENGGLSDARNIGIKNSIGKYIIFLDSDDYWDGSNNLLKKLEKIIVEFNPDVIIHGYCNAYKDKKERIFFPEEKYGNLISDLDFLIKNNIYNTIAWNKIIRRDLIIKNNIEFPKGKLHEDCSWCFDIIPYIKNYYYFSDTFYQYRLDREGSITNVIKTRNINDLIDILENKLNYIESNNIDLSNGIGYYIHILHRSIYDKFYLMKKNQEVSILLHRMNKINIKYNNILINFTNIGKFGNVKRVLFKVLGFKNTFNIINFFKK
ncbi:hypothetical protein A6A19_08275 [Actinobacillus delphinicola]|uniref:glycosyltransferase n=1 Tax=Actinobacillus delphinicola TaxID=51161 RepID=UPI00244314D1|nr:glycosyltransferase [Actinobacillus delphinicola]MDG6897969.1 hypothetical protein [Actinobacillus delphinicola]